MSMGKDLNATIQMAFNYVAVLLRGTSAIGTHEFSGSVNTTINAVKVGPGLQMQTQADLSTCEFTIANLKIRKIN